MTHRDAVEFVNTILRTDGTITKQTVFSVQITKVVVGWLVVEQYGPVRRRRWHLRKGPARAAYERALVVADGYLDELLEIEPTVKRYKQIQAGALRRAMDFVREPGGRYTPEMSNIAMRLLTCAEALERGGEPTW